jgi:hypothetical protein
MVAPQLPVVAMVLAIEPENKGSDEGEPAEATDQSPLNHQR